MFVLDREDCCEDGNNEYEDSGGMMLNPKYDEDPDSEWKYINEADERGQDEDPEQDQLGPATYVCAHCGKHKNTHRDIPGLSITT